MHYDDRSGDPAVLYEPRDEFALAHFRQIHLTVALWNLYVDDTGKKPKGIASFFKRVESILANRVDKGNVKLKVKFELKLDGHEKWGDTFDPSRSFNINRMWSERRAAFFRAQIRELLSCLRLQLQHSAPYVTMETNAEQDGFKVRVKRMSSTSVLFKVPAGRTQGEIALEEDRGDHLLRSVQHAFREGWDDSDLDTYV
jgi:hypothetical protein